MSGKTIQLERALLRALRKIEVSKSICRVHPEFTAVYEKIGADLFMVTSQKTREDTMTKSEERLKDIREHPENHRHDFNGLQNCAFIDGAIDASVMQAHEGLIGHTNGGRRCDVSTGPCACGAWH